jgi:hypothetical protein
MSRGGERTQFFLSPLSAPHLASHPASQAEGREAREKEWERVLWEGVKSERRLVCYKHVAAGQQGALSGAEFERMREEQQQQQRGWHGMAWEEGQARSTGTFFVDFFSFSEQPKNKK